jgi:hypothetical protein
MTFRAVQAAKCRVGLLVQHRHDRIADRRAQQPLGRSRFAGHPLTPPSVEVSVRSSEPVEGKIDVAGDSSVIILVSHLEQVVDQLHVATVSTSGGRQGPAQKF